MDFTPSSGPAIHRPALLHNFPQRHPRLVCFDSDGCVFNTMEIKQRNCIIPNLIRHWGLEAVADRAWQAAEFVNLYSVHRGANRFQALLRVFDLLAGLTLPPIEPLRAWVARSPRLSNEALRAELAAAPDPVLARALAWSEAVDRSVAEHVRAVPPFPLVRESLALVSRWADVLVCSTTSMEALDREWREHDLARYTTCIAGQEMGAKAEHIRLAAAGRYPPGHILMIGDAPGDLDAARANGAWFYPILAGEEPRSWDLFFKEAAPRFEAGLYTEEWEQPLVREFLDRLPAAPPWKR